MKHNKVKFTLVMVMIMVMSLTLFSVAYAAVYKPEFVTSAVKNVARELDIDDDIEEDLMSQVAKVSNDGSELPKYNRDTLAKYNGQNGQPSYVAFKGLVYELTNFTSWIGGFHNGYEAGKDLTDAFQYSPHTDSIFDKAKVVGTFSNDPIEIKVAKSDEDKTVDLTTIEEVADVALASPKQVNGVSQTATNFTAETLAQYNGKNGQPAYIAFEGVVYEVGKFTSWVGGFHNGYEAGKDLTKAFENSPHARSIFNNAQIVGTYGDPGKDTGTLTETVQEAPSNIGTGQNDTQNTSVAAIQTVTLAELAKYTGQNGQPAYIAVNGLVYDVTSYWKNGQHKGLQAGTDMTTAFAGSPHSQAILNDLPVIGQLSLDQQVIDPTIQMKTGDDHEDYEDDDYEDDDYEDDDDEDEDDDHDDYEDDDDEDEDEHDDDHDDD